MFGAKRKEILKSRLLIWIGVPLLAWYISANWYQLTMIQGRSMHPTYRHLQMVLLNKHEKDYRRGDVVAFSCEGLSAVLVKRIAAEPGDTVMIRDRDLLVNGVQSALYPEEDRFFYAGLLSEEIILADGEYIVLGDNTDESIDSRYPEVGILRREVILGTVCGNGFQPK